MKMMKRILCFLLCAVILWTAVGTKYLDANHMEKVEAAGAAVVAGGITLATIFEICLFVGTAALAAYGLGEAYENREEIARFGKEFIDSCSDTASGWVMQFVDASGQDYVFGSEALELVRGTEWSVIQGGMPPEGDPNKKGDKDKDKFHIPGNPLTHVAQFTALGATWFTTNAKNIYQDWCDILDGWKGKDTPIPGNNVLINNFPQAFTDADVAEQFSGNLYTLNMSASTVRMNCSATHNPTVGIYSLSRDMAGPSAYCVSGGFYYFASLYDGGIRLQIASGKLTHTDCSGTWNSQLPPAESVAGFSSSVPVFYSLEAAEAYLETGTGYEDAANYNKNYRIADWLQQDWAGTLIDPLVNIGLTLAQLIELCRQLGLKTVQGLTAAELIELLKNALPGLDPALFPGISPAPSPAPVVDPAVDPVYYPDPDAHPAKPPRPKIDPAPKPKPDPGPKPGPEPDPGPDPDPQPDPDPGMDAADYRVELTWVFPFCIPFDFIALLKALDANPRAPCFSFPVVIPALNYREDVKLDLSVFDDVAKVIRLCEKAGFILFLMFVTSKVIRW